LVSFSFSFSFSYQNIPGMWVAYNNVSKLHRRCISDAYLADTVNTTRI